MSHRNFLKVLAAAGATAAAGSALSLYAPWLNYGQAARHTGDSFTMSSDGPVRMRELVRYATLAANGHNTQPWKFALKEDAIEILLILGAVLAFIASLTASRFFAGVGGGIVFIGLILCLIWLPEIVAQAQYVDDYLNLVRSFGWGWYLATATHLALALWLSPMTQDKSIRLHRVRCASAHPG